MVDNSNHRILVIDDEDSIRESLSEFFRDYGLDTESVTSAEDGLEILNQKYFDLVVVDIRLPGINGDQFVSTAHKLNPQLRFIIHTGSVHFRITPELSAIGLTNNEVFLKPVFELEQLLDRVRALLPPKESR